MQPSSYDTKLTVYDHIYATFESALNSSHDAYTADQMDTVLGGAMQYARWACTEPQVLELRKLWLQWKKLYAQMDTN